jgi:transcription initiation factor TFIIA large subunit
MDDDDDKSNVLKEEDLDEDAINSDLDDPDEGLNDEEDDDEAMGHIMLCMYDKVQRVKNKWFVPSFHGSFVLC